MIIAKLRLFNKCREQCLRERIFLPAAFRVPLNSDYKAAAGVFDGLDDSIVSERDRTKVSTGRRNGLVVITVYFHL